MKKHLLKNSRPVCSSSQSVSSISASSCHPFCVFQLLVTRASPFSLNSVLNSKATSFGSKCWRSVCTFLTPRRRRNLQSKNFITHMRKFLKINKKFMNILSEAFSLIEVNSKNSFFSPLDRFKSCQKLYSMTSSWRSRRFFLLIWLNLLFRSKLLN